MSREKRMVIYSGKRERERERVVAQEMHTCTGGFTLLIFPSATNLSCSYSHLRNFTCVGYTIHPSLIDLASTFQFPSPDVPKNKSPDVKMPADLSCMLPPINCPYSRGGITP